MQEGEYWSGGGQDSAYFSQHSTMSECERGETSRKQKKGSQTTGNHFPSFIFRSSSRGGDQCDQENHSAELLLLVGPGEEVVLVHRK